MKSTLIVTTLNEGSTINELLLSILHQTVKPTEVVIVDGGSTDDTVSSINTMREKFKRARIDLNIFNVKGNRSVGRNYAVKKAKHKIILCTDAGCILDPRWIENMLSTMRKDKPDVVAGYYKSQATTI